MSTPDLPLDEAALDRLHDNHAHDLVGDWPSVIAQARAALTLAARVAELEAHASALRDALHDCFEWFDARADVDHVGDPMRPFPNAEAIQREHVLATLAAHPAASLAAHDARWTVCNDRHAKGCWPEAGADVLVALHPWKHGQPCYVTEAHFYWEGKDHWRPTFRGGDGDSIKSVYAWAPKPDAPPMPDSLAQALAAQEVKP